MVLWQERCGFGQLGAVAALSAKRKESLEFKKETVSFLTASLDEKFAVP